MFPNTNDLQFARARNGFLSESEIEQSQWAEAIGFTQSPEYASSQAEAQEQAIHAAVEQASALIDSSRIEANQIAVSTEHDTTAEHGYFIAYAKGYGRGVQTLRDYKQSDFDLAA